MSSFDDFIEEIEREAEREGPVAVAELENLRSRYMFARDLLALRKRKGITQTQLAEDSGIAQPDISLIERGEGNPTVATLNALAKPLGGRLGLVPL